jgi:hypothetical protein
MATAAELNRVRRNVDEPDDSNDYTDDIISDLIREFGVDGASATIWTEKAAKWSALADVTEAGATHRFSALAGNALSMAKQFAGLASAPEGEAKTGPVIRTIERD